MTFTLIINRNVVDRDSFNTHAEHTCTCIAITFTDLRFTDTVYLKLSLLTSILDLRSEI